LQQAGIAQLRGAQIGDARRLKCALHLKKRPGVAEILEKRGKNRRIDSDHIMADAK